MSVQFELVATRRDDQGKGASRRLRRTGQVPGIIYGGEKPPMSISVEARVLNKQLENEAFYSHVLTVSVDGSEEKAVLRDLQRHPAQPMILHFDLMRVNEDTPVRVHVPLHYLNEAIAPGVKTGGGMINHHLVEVEITCLPKDLPEFIEVDLGGMELNDSIHLSELKLPAGVSLVELSHGEGHDQAVVAIHPQRVGGADAAEGESSAGEGEGEEA
ncbi:50S ribosomal protein L25/general stress protein Ctc [Acidihalobacter aeolianus]|uniref:Large ribosomal subunit protein bL25 n=1 Tax=Acidihalobacter aeolianus TaxID=2792603 RepID=A0A1D8KAP7_9GAMM|nr:50S ribosomal protein L25/general stress protein Ctc [Acidihalobacter aeolianus]AOV18007.1 50S ribosomal protein L25/general stress protein Ctc [Acidihalobacter aeolianus]